MFLGNCSIWSLRKRQIYHFVGQGPTWLPEKKDLNFIFNCGSLFLEKDGD